MKKLKRTSYFDSNRSSFLDAEKQEYVYEFISYDENGHEIPTRQAIAITKDNIEIIKMLDGFDHEEDLQLLYERRHKEKFIDYDNDVNDSGEANRETGIANIPDKKYTIEKLLFEDDEVDANEVIGSDVEDEEVNANEVNEVKNPLSTKEEENGKKKDKNGVKVINSAL